MWRCNKSDKHEVWSLIDFNISIKSNQIKHPSSYGSEVFLAVPMMILAFQKTVCDTDIIPLASLSQTNKSPNVKKDRCHQFQAMT